MNELRPSARTTILFLFWALVAVFAFTVLTMLVPLLRDSLRDAILWQAGALLLLGALLIARTARAPAERTLKRLLMLVGGSALGMVLGFLGHNLIYALATRVEGVRFLDFVLSTLEVAFFLAAVVVFPVLFIISAATVIVVLTQQGGTSQRPPADDLTPAH